MTYAEVCAGIAASTVAWHPLGWRCAWFAEVDPFCNAVLEHHYPEVPNLGDFTKITAAEPVDLLVAGTPCQSFSVAGRRAGLDDPRGVLAFEFLALADRLRPRWVAFENVPGLLSSNGGRDFGAFLGALGECGYGWAYRILDAQYAGVPQRRRRVFVVGYLGDWRRAAAVLFERESVSGHPAPRREERKEVAGPLGASTDRGHGGGGLRNDLDGNGAFVVKGAAIGRKPEAGPQYGEVLADGSCYTLNATEVHAVAHTLSGSEGGCNDPNRAGAFVFVQNTRDEVRLMGGDGQMAGALPAEAGMKQQNYVFEPRYFTRDNKTGGAPSDTAQLTRRSDLGDSTPVVFESRFARNDRGAPSAVCPPLKARCGEDGRGDAAPLVFGLSTFETPKFAEDLSPPVMVPSPTGGGQPPAVAFAIGSHAGAADGDQTNRSHAKGGPVGLNIAEELAYSLREGRNQSVAMVSAVRRLTPRECERLQGLPDDYTLVPYHGKPAKDGPRYRALGNSMAVPCMRWIGERIRMVEEVT